MTVQADVVLAAWSTLEVGGPARWFCEATHETAVIDALTWARERRLPVHILGGGSNVVFADEGFEGLVLRVDIRGVAVGSGSDAGVHFSVGAGEPWDPFVAATVEADCAGLECLSGIPGQVGGTPVQNVGAYGQDVSETITRVHAIDRRSLRAVSFSNAECAFEYRSSRFKREDEERYVITRVEFSVTRGGAPTMTYADVVTYFDEAGEDAPSLQDVRKAVLRIRRRKGMVIEDGNPVNRSVGSFFVNPVIPRFQFAKLAADDSTAPHYPVSTEFVKVPAAWLIERSGFMRGHARGQVGVSPFQAQALVNFGGGRAADILALASDIKRAVWRRFQIALVPEPIFVGFSESPELRTLLDPQPRN